MTQRACILSPIPSLPRWARAPWLAAVLSTLAVITVPARASHAGGLTLGEAGAQAQQRASAVLAKADDPGAIQYNPAGLVKTRGVTVLLSSTLIVPSLRFQRAGVYQPPAEGTTPYAGRAYPAVENQAAPQIVPSVAVAWGNGRAAFAVGLTAPHASPSRDFPCRVRSDCPIDETGAPAPQRYDTVAQKVLVVEPSLGGAIRVTDRLSLGARVTWGTGWVEARTFPWGIRNLDEDVRRDGDFEISASDLFIPGYAVGALYEAAPWLELGAAFRSGTPFRGRGTGTATLGTGLTIGTEQDFIAPVADASARCAPGGRLSALSVCLDFDLPASAGLGARVIFRDAAGAERGDLELDLVWEDWSAASDTAIIVDGQSGLTGLRLRPQVIRHGFEDTISVRVGGSARVAPGGLPVELRGGVAWDSAAAPVSWTRVDQDGTSRLVLAVGGEVRLGARSRWRVELGVALALQPTRDVTDVDLGANPPPDARVQPDPVQPLAAPGAQVYSPFNAGRYESGYVIGSLGVKRSL